MYKCRSRKHYWRKKSDADKCCDPRWIRVLSFTGGNSTQIIDGQPIGRIWLEVVKEPESASEVKMYGSTTNPYRWTPE